MFKPVCGIVMAGLANEYTLSSSGSHLSRIIVLDGLWVPGYTVSSWGINFLSLDGGRQPGAGLRSLPAGIL